jgi:site-specific DNA-adenine methylase
VFSYYGGKGRIARYYPKPQYPLIIEPFAGGSWYSTFNLPEKAILVDPDPIIVETWRWLIHEATVEDLKGFPDYIPKTRMIKQTPAGKDYFYRFWGNRGSIAPKNFAGSFNKKSWISAISRLPKIKSWKIIQGTYRCLGNIEATWFIDPPYQSEGKGSLYKFSEVNYDDLHDFCLSRRGQVIVCDREGADWMPFKPLERATKGQRNQLLKEVYWVNTMKEEKKNED